MSDLAFHYYQVGPANYEVGSLVVAPDKTIWFTMMYENDGLTQAIDIGQFNPTTGDLSVYPYSNPGIHESLGRLTFGPGGDLWFSDSSGLGSFDPTTHAFTQHSLGSANGEVAGIAPGPDGNIWFTDRASIGVFNPTTGKTSEYPLPDTNDSPTSIVAGPDGNIWFTVEQPESIVGWGSIGSINPTTHAITLVPTGGVPNGITVGPDGNIWFNDDATGQLANNPYADILVGEINPRTDVVTEYPGGGTDNIISGPDNSLWSPQSGIYGDQIDEIDPTTHTTIEYNEPNTIGYDLVAEGSNTLWLASSGLPFQSLSGYPADATAAYLVSASFIPSNQSAIAGYVALDPMGTVPAFGLDVADPIENQRVFLDLKNDGQFDPGDPTATTNAFGYYTFTGLTPGTYTVRVAPSPGNIVTSPAAGSETVTVAGGQLGSPDPIGMIPSSSVSPIAYNTAPFGSGNPDVQTAEVNGVYNLVLGHAPDSAGLAAWVQALKNGVPLSTLSNYLLTSPEYDTNLILSYYRNYLADPNPGVAAVNEWVGFMQAGMTAKQAASYFMSSDVFSNLFPSNESFIQALYGDVLGYLPASWEIESWLNVLGEGVTRAEAVNAFLDSSASDTRIVTGLYGTILLGVDPNGLATYVAALEAGWTPVQVATSLFGSAEFTARANATVG
jgi:streptogramin lyase